MTTMIIIPRGKEFGTCNGVITPTATLFLRAMRALKEGKAELLIDTEEILMYRISE